jgi:hypothetical protein
LLNILNNTFIEKTLIIETSQKLICFMNISSSKVFMVACFMFSVGLGSAQQPGKPIWQSKEYAVFGDRITQGNKFVAKALSAKELTSNYQSPANLFQSPVITFKFSINGKDNEMKSGTDHQFICSGKDGTYETPLIQFGDQYEDSKKFNENSSLSPGTKLTIHLDMRKVLNAFKTTGYYVTFDGSKIYKDDFKGVYVAGSCAPLIWDFDNLVNHPDLELNDTKGDGIYDVTLEIKAVKNEKLTDSHWVMSKDVAAFPQYKSDYLISDVIYNMSLEEMVKAVEPDSTFRTGKEWAGVWTRDISYSIILSMAYMQPIVARNSLMKKVKNGRIIQDTGTGGAYPVSTDRMIWATAAWELYKVTGDREWLKNAYTIIKNSAADDTANVYDQVTGLVKGESSFLDWREQTYPRWMQPADIFESMNLGTNAVHYNANKVLSEMALQLNDKESSLKYENIALKIKAGVNKYLWMNDKGYYGQYLYGRDFKMLSPRSEALGEALCVLFSVADEAKQRLVIASTPVTSWGISCIYPQISGIPPYHNNAVWPFVQSYWALAAAKAGNEKAVMESISAFYRPAAMFLTNKENFVASNGDFAGTQINSSNMLWSLSGNIALVHKVLFGIEFMPDRLIFHPFVPMALKGNRSLSNFKYRKAILNIEMKGYGNTIHSFMLDGKEVASATIPATLQGVHAIKILLGNNMSSNAAIHKVENYTSLQTPVVTLSVGELSWIKIDGAKEYLVFKNGKKYLQTKESMIILKDSLSNEYQVVAIDEKGYSSFASEPFRFLNTINTKIYEVEDFYQQSPLDDKGYSGKGFVEISKTINPVISIPVSIQQSGFYSIDYRYSNGNGPTNTENKCAVRGLYLESGKIGTLVFPQRGKGEWSNWGFTNSVRVYLSKGEHVIRLTFDPANENMNGAINKAMVDYLRLSQID